VTSGQAGQAAGAAANGASPPQVDGFVALDEDSIRGYIAAQPDLAARLGGADTVDQWTVRMVSSTSASQLQAHSGRVADGRHCQATEAARVGPGGWRRQHQLRLHPPRPWRRPVREAGPPIRPHREDMGAHTGVTCQRVLLRDETKVVIIASRG